MFLVGLRKLPWCGDRTPGSAPSPAEGRFSPSNTPVFLPSSFILPSFAWVYIFFYIATHSGILAWKIPWTEDPGRLQSMGSQRVGHDWVTSLHFTLYILFRWSGTPVRCPLLFCMHFCVWTCNPDVSVERDVLHILRFLRHLVTLLVILFIPFWEKLKLSTISWNPNIWEILILAKMNDQCLLYSRVVKKVCSVVRLCSYYNLRNGTGTLGRLLN